MKGVVTNRSKVTPKERATGFNANKGDLTIYTIVKMISNGKPNVARLLLRFIPVSMEVHLNKLLFHISMCLSHFYNSILIQLFCSLYTFTPMA